MYWKHIYTIVSLIIVVGLSTRVFAQKNGELKLPKLPKGSVAEKIQDRSFDDTQVLLKQEFTGGAVLHTQGWGLILRRAKNKTFLRKHLFELEVVSMEHPKEVRSVNPYYENSNAYVYGELNQIVVSRVGYGRHNVLYAKFDRGVEIRYLYIGGFSLAWAKPIYLEIGYPTIPYEYVATERYDPERHSVDNIFCWLFL